MLTGDDRMSQKEVDRLIMIQRVINKQLSQIEAAAQLDLSTRQIRNLKREYQRLGSKGLISKRRGQPSNNGLSKAVKKEVINLIEKHYADFGPTLAHEKLTEQHELKLSVESVRKIMIENELWFGKKRRKASVHQSRERRSQRGELVQIDGSPHDWFESRGSRCCLIVFVDDATSQLLALHFVEQECTQGYFTAIEAHLKQHGRPLSYYSDRHSIFRVNTKEANSGTGETQLGRALRELDIQLICAHSPQAKGRVEKANGTLQDRLVKEMRLRGISDIDSANAFLPEFMADYNRRFSVIPANPVDAHRAVVLDPKVLKHIFSQRYLRKVSKNLEVSYNNVIYQIQSKNPSYTLRRAYITICERDNEITLLYKQSKLPYSTIDKHNRPTPIQDKKESQGNRSQYKPKAEHPWRSLFLSQKHAAEIPPHNKVFVDEAARQARIS